MARLNLRQLGERLRRNTATDSAPASPLDELPTSSIPVAARPSPQLYDIDERPPPSLTGKATVKPLKIPQSYQPYSLKRDRYVSMDERGYAIAQRRRHGLVKVTTPEASEEVGFTLNRDTASSAAKTEGSRETRNPRYYHSPKPNMSNVPITPDLEQLVHRSVFDVLVVLASKSVHCAQLQLQYPLVQFVPLATHPTTDSFLTGRDTKHYQFNIFMGQTPDSSPNEQIQLVQSMFQQWIAKDATLHGLRTVHPQNANKNGQHRHFHTFNMHQEWWVPANAFFKQSVLLEPGGAWVGVGPEGQQALQTYISEFKKNSGHLRYRVGTPTNLLVLELSGENGGRQANKNAKRKVIQPPPVPTSANPVVESPITGTGGNFPSQTVNVDPAVLAHRARNAENRFQGSTDRPQRWGYQGVSREDREQQQQQQQQGMGGMPRSYSQDGTQGFDMGTPTHSYDGSVSGAAGHGGFMGGAFGSPANINPVPIRVGVPGFSPTPQQSGAASPIMPKMEEVKPAPVTPSGGVDMWTVSAS